MLVSLKSVNLSYDCLDFRKTVVCYLLQKQRLPFLSDRKRECRVLRRGPRGIIFIDVTSLWNRQRKRILKVKKIYEYIHIFDMKFITKAKLYIYVFLFSQ